MDLAQQERDKYETMWENNDYRKFSPGERFIWPFLMEARPLPGSTIFDFGVGCGRAALFFLKAGFDVWGVDIADNCLDPEVAPELSDRLLVACLWDDDLPLGQADYIYCTDVMEHIPEDKVDAVLKNIAKHSKQAFLNISFVDDEFGETIGETLHLTVHDFKWWIEKLEKYFNILLGKDMITGGTFYVEALR